MILEENVRESSKSTIDEDILLIIDDDIELLQRLLLIFDGIYTVKMTTSVDEAYLILKNFNVSVILCDQRMSEMKGTDFFSSIRNDYPDIIKILTTSYATLNDVITGINEGHIYRYLTKPWNIIELKDSVSQAFKQIHLIKDNKRMVEELRVLNKQLEEKVRIRTKELQLKNEELEKLNKQFENLATHDSLTGLNNSRLLQSIFDYNATQALRLSLKLMLVMIDLNNFKKVNDEFGHIAGDDLLKVFANIVSSNIRENFDTVFRVGGDEFLVLFFNCNEEHALLVMNKIDSEFRKTTKISSVSYGIIEVDVHQKAELSHWIALADQQMYAYKNKTKGK